ncbi:MAG: hypothetical protein R3293_26405, partial [Candidatus Promineifilaceae bacterium]|nr:hypothetical protein [Candidatus Promineifilaceae bacterium]
MTESSNGLEEDFTEPSTFKSALSRAGGRARRRWFWLINLALLLLFLWTLTEESAVHVQVEGGTCTAVFPEGRGVTRSSSIPCPGLGGGFVGLTFRGAGRNEWLTRAPLDWLLPRSGWRSVAVSELGENGRRQVIEIAHEVPGWRRLWGEWQPLTRMAAMQWQTPIHSDYQVSAALRRPEEPAGILLLQPDSKSGWAFITDPANRRGAWWEWHDGRLGEPLVGIPYQKPLLAQAQSLLRRLLRAQQGALLLLFAGWLAVILSRRLRGGKFKSLHSITFDRLWPLKGGRERLALLVLALAACGAAAIIAALILERMPHVQDSLTYLFQAQLLAQGRLWADAPPLPEFFEHEFLAVSDGRWFGQYPPGFPFLLAIGVRLGQPWLINPILAGLTLVLLYLLGRALFGRSTGFIAAVLALTSPFLLF